MRSRIAVFALILTCSISVAQLPAGYESLTPLAGDEMAYVKELRRIDRAQNDVIQSLLQAADALAKGAKMEEAKAKADEAQQIADGVRAAYENALLTYKGNARLHNYYGELLMDYYDEEAAALKEWNLAISLDATLGDPYNNLALFYFHGGEYSRGLSNLEEALRLEPKNPDYLFNMVQVYMVHGPQIQKIKGWDSQSRVYKDAMKMSAQAAKLDRSDYSLQKDYALNFWRAEPMGAKPAWGDAAKACAHARETAPNPTEQFFLWLQEGRAWIQAGNDKKAQPALEKALELNPSSEVTKTLLAQVRDRRGKK